MTENEVDKLTVQEVKDQANKILLSEQYYNSTYPLNTFAFSYRPDERFRFALGSYLINQENHIDIIQYCERENLYLKLHTINQTYPASKLQWIPDETGQFIDILAISSDHLRLWNIDNTGTSSKFGSEFIHDTKPLTSFDWSTTDPTIIATCSLDSTCTIWDVDKKAIKSKFLAHEGEVYDINIGNAPNTFMTVGSDGTLRHFDIRDMNNCTILLESLDHMPYMKVAWNRLNPYLVAVTELGSKNIEVVDTRWYSDPYYQIKGHSDLVNSITWSPLEWEYLATAGDDKKVKVWDLIKVRHRMRVVDAANVHNGSDEIISLQWPFNAPDYIGLLYTSRFQIIKI